MVQLRFESVLSCNHPLHVHFVFWLYWTGEIPMLSIRHKGTTNQSLMSIFYTVNIWRICFMSIDVSCPNNNRQEYFCPFLSVTSFWYGVTYSKPILYLKPLSDVAGKRQFPAISGAFRWWPLFVHLVSGVSVGLWPTPVKVLNMSKIPIVVYRSGHYVLTRLCFRFVRFDRLLSVRRPLDVR